MSSHAVFEPAWHFNLVNLRSTTSARVEERVLCRAGKRGRSNHLVIHGRHKVVASRGTAQGIQCPFVDDAIEATFHKRELRGIHDQPLHTCVGVSRGLRKEDGVGVVRLGL